MLISLLMLGAVVGFVAGLLGVGGGAVMVPVLTSLFIFQGIPVDKVVHLALGTSMAAMIVTSISSMMAHKRNSTIDWSVFRHLVLGVILGAFLATFIVPFINALYLSVFFASFMGYVSFNMLRAKQSIEGRGVISMKELWGVGVGIGGISALVSIGGGSMTVPYLFKHNFPMVKAIGTSAAIGVPLSIAGSVGYFINGWPYRDLSHGMLGFVYLPAVVAISVMSALFAPLGAKAAHKLPVNVLKKIFAVFLVLLSLNMVVSVIHASA